MSEIWFDIRLGEQLIGDDVISARLEESGPGDVVPLVDLLTCEEFPINPHECKRQDSRIWDKEMVTALGVTVMNLFKQSEVDLVPGRPTFERLYYLGIGPHPGKYGGPQGAYPTMQDFRNEIGAGIGRVYRKMFDTWTTGDFARFASDFGAELGRRPRSRDYAARARTDLSAPPIRVIERNFTGGVGELNEHAGYPNVKSWTTDDYIDYGVRFMLVNGPDAFSYPAIIVLSERERGPGYASIVNKFPSFAEYKSQVTAEYLERKATAEYERQTKLASYKEQIDKGLLPADFKKFCDDDLLQYAGRYRLSLELIPEMTEFARMAAVTRTQSLYFARELTRYNADLSVGIVEVEASIMGVYDDLWPETDYKEYLKVNEEEIADVRARRHAPQRARILAQRHQGELLAT